VDNIDIYMYRRDVASMVEGVIWHAWMAHADPQVNKAMRLGVSNLKRGDTLAAHDCFTEASVLDPLYPEAHNKLAAMYHKAGQYEECLKRAELTLALCPYHYGALAGLGMSLEKKGDKAAAIEAFRKSLNFNPWANHVPTVFWCITQVYILISIQNN
jgi:tetratricopeptide (TPR) repeat protein